MKYQPQLTADGSGTFFSEEFGQTYHSSSGARQEAIYKYALALDLPALARRQQPVRLLDICYGLGYNSAAALATIWAARSTCPVELVALELDPQVPSAAIAQGWLADWPAPIPDLLTTLARAGLVEVPLLRAELRWGDARQTLPVVVASGWQADAIFLDPFAPASCPQLWTVEFLNLVARCCAPEGKIATYSCGAAVRSALVAAGLTVADSNPVGRRAPGTIAAWEGLPPLSMAAQEHLQTRAAVPYRDPTLGDRADQILDRRHREQQTSTLEPTSRWKNRWYPPNRSTQQS